METGFPATVMTTESLFMPKTDVPANNKEDMNNAFICLSI